jgi:hypothetical protein
VPAYNSNGLWLKSPIEVGREAVELRDEEGFKGVKLRLGRERLSEDLTTIEAVRETVGSEMSLMVDFNQGLQLGEALERATRSMISVSPGAATFSVGSGVASPSQPKARRAEAERPRRQQRSTPMESGRVSQQPVRERCILEIAHRGSVASTYLLPSLPVSMISLGC